jgi:hypothetical protein
MRHANFFFIRLVGEGLESIWVLSARRPPILLLYLPPGDYEDGEFGGMMIGKGNRIIGRKPAPVPLCSPQIPHDLNPGRRGGKPATNRLSYGAAMTQVTFLQLKRPILTL